MVAVTITLDLMKTDSLDAFDVEVAMAHGDSSTVVNVSDTTLGNEIFRGPFNSSTKNSGAGTFEFQGRIPITEMNANTLKEIAIFNSLTADAPTMSIRELTPIEVTKTSDEEILVTGILTITTNNT